MSSERNIPSQAPKRLSLAGKTIDFDAEQLLDGTGKPIEVRRQAFVVLSYLALHAGRLVTKDELIAKVWPEAVVTDDSLVQAVRDARKALDDDTHEIISTVRGRGYRLSSAALDIQSDQSDKPPQAMEEKPSDNGQLLARSRLSLLFGVLSLLLIGLTIWWQTSAKDAVPVVGKRPAIVVLSLGAMSTAPTDKFFREGFAEELTLELARSRYLQVVSQHSMRAVARRSDDKAQRVSALQARYAVGGRLGMKNDQLLIRLHLTDMESDQIILSMNEVGTSKNLDETRARLLEQITTSLHHTVNQQERSQLQRRQTGDLNLYALSLSVLSRKHTFNPQQLRLGREEGERALQIDPTYPPALVNLAYLNFIDAANLITGVLSRKDIPAVENMLYRGLTLDSNNPTAWQLMSHIRGMQGRIAESLEAAERAVRLAPGDPDTLFVLAKAQVSAGKLEDALLTYEKAGFGYPIEPAFFQAFRARAYYAAGDYDKAIALANDCLSQAPKLAVCWVEKIVSLVAQGKTEEAIEASDQMLELIPKMSQRQFSWTFQSQPELATKRTMAASLVGLPE